MSFLSSLPSVADAIRRARVTTFFCRAAPVLTSPPPVTPGSAASQQQFVFIMPKPPSYKQEMLHQVCPLSLISTLIPDIECPDLVHQQQLPPLTTTAALSASSFLLGFKIFCPLNKVVWYTLPVDDIVLPAANYPSE